MPAAIGSLLNLAVSTSSAPPNRIVTPTNEQKLMLPPPPRPTLTATSIVQVQPIQTALTPIHHRKYNVCDSGDSGRIDKHNIFWSPEVNKYQSARDYFINTPIFDNNDDNDTVKPVIDTWLQHNLKKYWIHDWIKTNSKLLESLGSSPKHRCCGIHNDRVLINVEVGKVPHLKCFLEAEWKYIINHKQNNDPVTLVLVSFASDAVLPSTSTSAATSVSTTTSSETTLPMRSAAAARSASGFVFSFTNVFHCDTVLKFQLENAGTCV